MARTDAASVLVQKLILGLEEARSAGSPGYPLTAAQLAAQVAPEADPALLLRALKKKPHAARLSVARRNDLGSPLALAEDADRLADSPLLLSYALGLVCTPKKPAQPVARVVGKMDRDIQPAFLAALEARLARHDLPPDVGQVSLRNQPHLYLQHMPPPAPKKKPAQLLSERLLQVVQEQPPGADFPLTLAQLAAAVEPSAKPPQLKQATALPPFSEHALVALPGKVDSPVARLEDLDRLAGSDALLRHVLAAATTPAAPLADLDRLRGLLEPRLQPAFDRGLQGRLEARSFPPGIEVLAGPQLGLTERLPPARGLALKLLHGLAACRQEDDYPLPLSRLLARVTAHADADLVRQALKERALKPQLLVVVPGHPDSPVALAEDAARLADWSALLSAVVAIVRTAENQAVPARDLVRKVSKPLQPALAEDLHRRLDAGQLPPEIGLLRIKRTPHLFLLRDLQGSPSTLPSPDHAAPPPADPDLADFAARFDQAFAYLDRALGGHNLVSLVPLREALDVSRSTFDAGLHQLRRAGQYSLSAAEGRHGISPEEQAAGLREDGALLLFVSRKV